MVKLDLRSSGTHQFVSSAFGADDILAIRDEALACHGYLTKSANKALGVPMTAFERNESCSTRPRNGLTACSASFGKKFPEAGCTVRLVLSRCKLLSS